MPNPQNITEPVTLIAYGRSGTSLLFRAFAARTDTDITGETGNLIFTPWRGLEQVAGLTRFGKMEDINQYGETAAEIVRHAFLTVYPSDKPIWMQKPIGTPLANEFFGDDVAGFVDWYWEVFNRCFPKARKFSILRHPNDVYLSGKRFWGSKDEDLWRTQWMMYRILGHKAAGLKHVLLYEQLVAEPEAQMRQLMAKIDLPFEERMMTAFGQIHVASRGTHVKAGTDTELKQMADRGFSHRDAWGSIKPNRYREMALKEYRKLRRDALAHQAQET